MGNGGPARVSHGTREADGERREENPERGRPGGGAVHWSLALNSACVCVCLCVRALLQVSMSAQGSVMNKVIATKCV